MNINVQVSKSPLDQVRRLFEVAFTTEGKKDKHTSRRAVKRILKLAAARGYKHHQDFMDYFKYPENQSERMTERWITSLFEYVSADEVCQLAELS